MTPAGILSLLPSPPHCNLHSHTQFCDGHAPMEELAAAARDAGITLWGISPHAPICVESPCNMTKEDVAEYLDRAEAIKGRMAPDMKVVTGMEVDFISPDFGPHIDYFLNLPLDYRIGSVHFVPTQEGIPMDCDGSAERFGKYLKEAYHDDLRYVVEKYFEHVLTMLERGGFEILGHFDKIAGNASAIDPSIEEQSWYEALVRDVISHAQSAGVLVEINTKAIHDRDRFYPSKKYWPLLREASIPILFNSDAHWPSKVTLGLPEAAALWEES